MDLVNNLQRAVLGFTNQEYANGRQYAETIISRINPANPNYSILEREANMGVRRDIQAQRLPPNVRVPSRRKPVKYLKTVHDHTGSWPLAARSYFSPGSWTSSGGSFKLADDAGYDLSNIMLDIVQQNGTATLLEVGAGYAGFKSESPAGIRKLVDAAGDQIGKNIQVHFTNLTKWHEQLPKGVAEHPGYVARDVGLLQQEGVRSADVIYSQCAAYFEPELEKFVAGSARLLNKNGYFIFNGPTAKHQVIVQTARESELKLEKQVELGGQNGNLYVFRK